MADISFFKNLKLPSGFSFFSHSGPSILGVDIGSSSVKVVQLKKTKERAILETYGELAIGPYAGMAVGQAARIPEEKMVELIKDLLKDAGTKAEDVVLSIPMRASFVLVIEVPFMKEHELSEAIPYEARKYVPVPVNEVVLDWWPIPEGFDKQIVGETGALTGKKGLMSVLIVAIHRETIESYSQIMAACNLKVRALEIEVFSAVRALVYRELAPVLFVDIGALSSKVAIVDYGIIRSAHSLEGGSQAVTMALSRSLGIDFIRAEEMKREIGLSNRPEHREVVGVIETVLDHTLAEAMKIFQIYQRKYRRSINRVILLGGGANTEGIVEYAVKKFGVEVALADPFRRVQYPVFLRPVLQDIGPSFTQAIGLAIREL